MMRPRRARYVHRTTAPAPVPPRVAIGEVRRCTGCGAAFEPTHPRQRACRPSCSRLEPAPPSTLFDASEVR